MADNQWRHLATSSLGGYGSPLVWAPGKGPPLPVFNRDRRNGEDEIPSLRSGISCPPGGSDQTQTDQWPAAIRGCFFVHPYASKLATAAQKTAQR